MGLIVGIDASRCRSGGAQSHIIGILNTLVPERHGICSVHIWSYASLLAKVPNRPWLTKHNPEFLERSLISQLWWQAVLLSREAKAVQCDVLFAADASTVCSFHPMVVLSQDMLSYEPGVMQHFGWGISRLRLRVILFVQNCAFKRAQGVIFLTRYAGRVIQNSCGKLEKVAYIPHGIDDVFESVERIPASAMHDMPSIRCLYVSNAAPYKHQWQVVKAVELLRSEGYPIDLELVGGGSGAAQRRLDKQIALSDPYRIYVTQKDFVRQEKLTDILRQADIFVFASSCENMPVTLLEGMAAGLPIACSNRGPMPEVLEDGGVYFDPERPTEIAAAIRSLIDDNTMCNRLSRRAKELSNQFTWARCSFETFKFLVEHRAHQ